MQLRTISWITTEEVSEQVNESASGWVTRLRSAHTSRHTGNALLCSQSGRSRQSCSSWACLLGHPFPWCMYTTTFTCAFYHYIKHSCSLWVLVLLLYMISNYSSGFRAHLYILSTMVMLGIYIHVSSVFVLMLLTYSTSTVFLFNSILNMSHLLELSMYVHLQKPIPN